jgi:hypothetical protein
LGHERLEVGQRLGDLGVLGAEQVDLGGDLGGLAAQLFTFGSGIFQRVLSWGRRDPQHSYEQER